jgi:glycosyltransferase involved in cell wall biosynthesis
LKAIFIIPFPPTYESFNKVSIRENDLNAPYQINNKGERVYFFRQDWGGIIGNHVMKADESIEWEVWRPDFRADQVMRFQFDDKLICKSFPATNRLTIYGISPVKLPYSLILEEDLIDELKKETSLVIILPTTVDFSKILHARILKYNPTVLYYHFLNPEFLLPQFDFTFNPLKMIHRFMINHQKRIRLRYITNLQVLSDELKNTVQSMYPAKKVVLARIGIDLSYWQNNTTREEARQILKWRKEDFVFILSQRLVPEYQVDRWIEALTKVSQPNFMCIITGAGTTEYIEYLSSLIHKSGLVKKVRLTGFVPNDELRTYITACDCFVMAGKKGGGSTGAIYAMLMNRLVFHTDSGVSCDILRKFNAGIIAKPYDYDSWPGIIDSMIVNKTAHRLVPPDFIQILFNWDTCARQWLDALKNI